MNATLLNKYMGYWKNGGVVGRQLAVSCGALAWYAGISCIFRYYMLACPSWQQDLGQCPLIVALVLLLSAIFNYINLTVAQIGNRAKEMATRRLLGESVLGVVLRYIKEAALFTAGCFLLGICWLGHSHLYLIASWIRRFRSSLRLPFGDACWWLISLSPCCRACSQPSWCLASIR